MRQLAPMFEERVYPAHKIAAVVGALADEGIGPGDALEGTGLTDESLRTASTRVSYRQTQTVFLNAIRLSRAPACAFRAGERMRVTAYGMYGYALLSSRTHEEAQQFALKFLRVMGPVGDVESVGNEREVGFSYAPLMSFDPDDPLYRFSVEFQMSSQYTLNRDLYGPSFSLSAVRLAYPPPGHADEYARFFGCPVRFGHARNELRFERRWVAEPMPFADPITNATARELCERSLAEVSKAGGVSAEVYRVLLERPGRFPSIDLMAEELRMNARTLRRRLEAERVSYRTILAEVRMRLAIEYLQETDMTNEEIAIRLGYSEAANFRHAFARWTMRSPSEYRRRQAACGPVVSG